MRHHTLDSKLKLRTRTGMMHFKNNILRRPCFNCKGYITSNGMMITNGERGKILEDVVVDYFSVHSAAETVRILNV
jgi:hypothetical protein